jgi:hypothetical protein
VPGPIFLDSSTISSITGGNSTNVDAHHEPLAAISDSSHKQPTRAHENLPKHKHKKKKKHSAPVVITVVHRL